MNGIFVTNRFVNMGKVTLRQHADIDAIEQERFMRYKNLPLKEQLAELFALINATILLNNGEPIKKPQGKGIVIKKLTT
jgi:hypothetical protein